MNPIGFGANAVGGHNLYPNLDEAEGRELVHTVLQQGVNFIDTAFIYGPKHSEELIGEVVKEQGNRTETIIATKAAHRLNHEGEQFNNHPTFLKTAVDEALGRLQT
ncbi:aldo/keto reductase family protein [Lysinibacillus fusiformis ZB2]|nr:aldo/keto reductase family protein [Lysinibacillus fusiformis ZB2]